MATNFLKNLFGSPKRPNKQGQEEADDVPQIPPERRLSLSKSGKMKRKNYSRQKSVTDESLYRQPSSETKEKSDSYTNSNFSPRETSKVNSENIMTGDDLNIEDVVEEMMHTAQTTRL